LKKIFLKLFLKKNELPLIKKYLPLIEVQSDPGPNFPKNLLNSPSVLVHLFPCHPQKSLLKSQSLKSTPSEGITGASGSGVVTNQHI